MKALVNLVRLHRWELNEKRKHLADLEALHDELERQKASLIREFEREKVAARASIEASSVFPAYLRQYASRKRKISHSLADLRERIEAAREDVAAGFEELKKHEILLANRWEQKKKDEERRDDMEQGEIGLNIYRRRRTQ